MLAFTGYSTRDQHEDAEMHAREDLKRLATMAAQRQEQVIEGARQTLAAISQAPTGDQARCNEFLGKLLTESADIYHSMGIYRADALLICNALPWQGPINSPDRLYLRIPLATGNLAVGEYQIGRVTKQQGINVGYPITDAAGKVTGVAFIAINLGRLNRMAAATPLPDGAILTVVDRDGVVLARNPGLSGRIGEKLQNLRVMETVLSARGIFELKATNGVERLWAYETVADNPDGVIPLRVLISIPMSNIFAAANRAYRINLVGIGLAAVLLLIAAWYGTEVLVLRKVRVLLAAAGRVHAGKLDTRTGLLHEGDELNQIGAAFDEMTESLQQREIELQQIMEKLKDQATTDPLTGLYNRRYLMEFLQRELARAARNSTPVAAIMLDIDHFKRFNDVFGHGAGDLVLKEIARLLLEHIRSGDMACRYGGEEFLLILSGSTPDGAQQRAENIRNLVEGLDLGFHDQSLGAITVSLRVASFPEHATDADALILAADGALYAAKAAGRDRVTVAIPGVSHSPAQRPLHRGNAVRPAPGKIM